ncbi:uncharacterized protein LOC123872631 [Maniola jurtina]|uniref:uncharacterized protein LOC123872631 n=1 Tax=Maniola jurtina TaxID=191418 RepID=UPI001E689D49|nr:uncharacterized protein LOC123872631 [Maniola jurtina]XP_045772988.1 uncharacterized protein LOC123872631 [Maniola jurtina]XP_045772997.1 uncharacterized protein LOC123872631 [Maniola jurtina]
MTVTSNASDNLTHSGCVLDESSNWNTLYCSHLWSNSHARKAIINGPNKDNKVIKYCYTCRGKIRNYGITPPKANFSPNNHSTPKVNTSQSFIETHTSGLVENNLDSFNYLDKSAKDRKTSITDININNSELSQYIPTISRQIDVSFRRKYTGTQYDLCTTDLSQRRLRKGLRGIGCIVNFSLTESPKTKRTQIQACSICVMIIAIVVISLVLVNYTTLSFMPNANTTSTILVPTENIDVNETSSAIVSISADLAAITEITEKIGTKIGSTDDPFLLTTTKNITHNNISNIILKIRKNIKTYPKDTKKGYESKMPKDIINRDLTQKFCSCQKNEVCMLDEINGVSICKIALDMDDPTGCGGLCAMETEACQLVDRVRGVRVCRLLTQVTCSPEDWRCRNGFCVPSTARCDGSIQCYDRSDEMHCDCDLTKQFRCGYSISCFSNKKMCDGLIDCWDGYDELNCTTECPEDQFTCTDGQCIMSSRFCDGLADCADGSDEPQGCDAACGTHEIQCKNTRCVPRGLRCDGQDDCGDGSDESHCS